MIGIIGNGQIVKELIQIVGIGYEFKPSFEHPGHTHLGVAGLGDETLFRRKGCSSPFSFPLGSPGKCVSLSLTAVNGLFNNWRAKKSTFSGS
jgi:hypothetical protein